MDRLCTLLSFQPCLMDFGSNMVWLNGALRPWLLSSLMLLISFSVKAEFVVVINESVDVEHISPQKLAHIYALQVKNWDNGQAIKAYTFPSNHADYKTFALRTLRIQPHQLNRRWTRMLFTGTGNPPIKVADDSEMLDVVRNHSGAIGYVKKHSKLDLSGVKVLQVGR